MTSATKYGSHVKKLAFQPGHGGANARELVFVSGEDLGGFDFNFIVGVYDQTGDWAPGRGAHTHPFDELLLFFGYDTQDMTILGSDMELCLGKELEPHKFSIPTAVVAPKGVPHCPLVTEKVYRPFGHFHLALSAKYAADHAEQEGKTDGKKYSNLVKVMKVQKDSGKGGANQWITMTGIDLEGTDINFTMGLYTQTGDCFPGKSAIVHPYNQVLVFFGHDTSNLKYLGAEIGIELGAEHEKHTFDVPTVVSIPAGMPYLPVVCNRLDKPFRIMQVGLAAEYKSSKL